MRIRRLFRLFVTTAFASLLFACSSVPGEIEEGLTPMEYFQRAQEASDSGRYELSMAYYEKFQEQYPEELDRNVWAEYEIALLYYKMGKNRIALERFDALLARYQVGEPDLPDLPGGRAGPAGWSQDPGGEGEDPHRTKAGSGRTGGTGGTDLRRVTARSYSICRIAGKGTSTWLSTKFNRNRKRSMNGSTNPHQ